MFRWLTRSRHVSAVRKPARCRLRLEALETRDCPAVGPLPSGPVINSFTAQAATGNNVQLSGSLTDANPATTIVYFTGVAAGQVYADTSGNFSLLVPISGPGTVTAQAEDVQAYWSNTVQTSVSSNAPVLTLNLAAGSGNSAILSGNVTDANPAGLTVTFNGAVSGSTTTDSNGNFSFTATSWASGTVMAQTTDSWGMASNTPTVVLNNATPVISNFAAIPGSEGMYTFQGNITTGYSSNMTVKLWGIPTLNGTQGFTTVPVNSNGSFCYSVQLTQTDHGTVSATATNWEGLVSATVTTDV